MAFGLPELADAVHRFVAANLPGRSALKIKIYTHEDASPFSMPVPPPVPAVPVFIPNAFQRAILKALKRCALHTDALAAKLGGDRRRIFRKPGGIAELKEHGLVANHPRLGYYRPDYPPEELAREE